MSYGSFNTRLFDASYDSGKLGADGKSRLMLDAHQMNSDGYQTYNYQKRDGIAGKYQVRAVGQEHADGLRFLHPVQQQHTAHQGADARPGGRVRQQLPAGRRPVAAELLRLQLLPDSERLRVHRLQVVVRERLDGGRQGLYLQLLEPRELQQRDEDLGDERRRQVQRLSQGGQPAAPGVHVAARRLPHRAVDGVPWTHRFQTPSDPRTWVDAAVPNFHETFGTMLLQPYAEYEFRATPKLSVTPGFKLSYYQQAFTQYADNGKKIGNLNGAPSITHTAAYHSWLPSFDVHYRLQPNWSAYAQFAMGDTIPPTSVFDVTGAQVAALPEPTRTKTYQAGMVWKSERLTLDVDGYYIHFDNDYSSYYDQTLDETLYFASGPSITKGLEAESNIMVGGGFNLYLNGTVGRATYVDTGLLRQNAPKDSETLGLNYQHRQWNLGMFTKRIGKMYNDIGTRTRRSPSTRSP